MSLKKLMDKLLRTKEAMTLRIVPTARTETGEEAHELSSGMTIKRSGIGEIITTRAAAMRPPELQSVRKTAPFAQIRP